MSNMFKLLSEKLRSGEDVCMVTVVASSGSTPRGAGSRMLVTAGGRIAGTIGGGAVEYRSEHIAADVLREKKSGEHDFTLTKDDVQNLGMICGGAVNVFFHYIPAFDEHTLKICDEAETLFAEGKDLWLVSDIKSGGTLSLRTGFSSRKPQRIKSDTEDYYIEQIISSGKVYVFGCGHVGQELVPVLSHIGFRCVALDDRPDFARRELFPDAEDVIVCDFEHLDRFISITSDDYCCVMTRGHSFDSIVQAQCLKSPACYIGVIGSARKKAGVYALLKEQYGFTDKDFERITSPIGLDIKAETPAEIAISIAAQMIEIRARRIIT